MIATGAALVAGLGAQPAGAAEAWTLHRAVDAPAALKLSGSFRLRYEALDGQFRPGANPTDDLVSLRTTLFAEYDAGPVRLGGELYDSRAYGGKIGGAVSANDVDAAELVQAYVATDLGAPFGAGSQATLQAGRFTLNLGSRRLVAADDYRNTTSGSTGLRLDVRTAGGVTATVLYTLPQVRLPDDQPSVLRNRVAFDRESFDLVLWGAVAAKADAFGKVAVDAAFLGLDEHDGPGRPTRNRALRTASLRLMRSPRPRRFDFEIEAAYQWGSIQADLRPAAPQLNVSASFVHVDAGYQFAGGWKPRVSVDYDRASGDDGKASYGRFDTLFGMRRADFAPSGIYAALGRANISTPGLRVEVTPSARLDGFVTYRGLWAASATDSFSTTGVRDPSGAAGSYAGRHLEGRLRYWLVPGSLRFEANGAILFKRGVLVRAPNAPRTGDTHLISLALTATF